MCVCVAGGGGGGSVCMCGGRVSIPEPFSCWILWLLNVCDHLFVLQLGYFSPLQVGTHKSNNFLRSGIQTFSVRLCFSKLIETEK